jgi:hypothetical protein
MEKKDPWLRDYEVEAATKGRISASWLRKDRASKQIFPFHRVGRMCFYRLTDIEAVFLKNRQGGKAA